MSSVSRADALAYVDGCMDLRQRRAFEALLDSDEALRRRVDLWAAQNEAIRASFGGRSSQRAAPGLGNPSNENKQARQAIPLKPGARTGPFPPARTTPQAASTLRAQAQRLARLALTAAAFSAFIVTNGPVDLRAPLARAGEDAYRAFAIAHSAPLDFTARDPAAIRAWLGPRFAHADLDIAGWTPAGVRMVPGVQSVAALVLYGDVASSRAGLLLEPLDSPRDAPLLADQGAGVAALAQIRGGLGTVMLAPSLAKARSLKPED